MRRSRQGKVGDSETEGFVSAGDNRETWSRYCETLRVKPGRRRISDASDCILPLALTFIGIHDGTSDVDRAFSRVHLLECKRRERHMSPELLHDCLSICLETPSTIEALVTQTPVPMRLSASDKSPMLQLLWRPQQLVVRAMGKYAMFFGTRRYASRSVLVRTLAEQATRQTRPRMQPMKLKCSPEKAMGKHALRKRLAASVSGVVKVARARQADKTSGTPQAASQATPGSTALTLRSLSSARPALSPGSSSSTLRRTPSSAPAVSVASSSSPSSGHPPSGSPPAVPGSQLVAIAALKRKRWDDRKLFENQERATGLAAPVRPLRIARARSSVAIGSDKKGAGVSPPQKKRRGALPVKSGAGVSPDKKSGGAMPAMSGVVVGPAKNSRSPLTNAVAAWARERGLCTA